MTRRWAWGFLAGIFVTLAVVLPAHADSDCSSFFLNGEAPVILVEARATTGREFCHTFYAVSYSTTRRDPIWSAEHLTRDMAMGADAIGRVNRTFGPQDGLSADEQGAHRDFSHSPFDRGHMTPANDAPDLTTEADTFVVTNIVPQAKKLNEQLWQYLEASVHQLAEQDGDVYIVTGPVFGSEPELLADRIAIPSATFKAIYVPSTGEVAAFVATNEDHPNCTIVSLAALADMIGVDPFPSLSPDLKAATPQIDLPHGVHIVSGHARPVPLPDCRSEL